MCLVAQLYLTFVTPGRMPWGFSTQEYWNGLPCPPPGHLSNPEIKPRSPALQANSLPPGPLVKPNSNYILYSITNCFICYIDL